MPYIHFGVKIEDHTFLFLSISFGIKRIAFITLHEGALVIYENFSRVSEMLQWRIKFRSVGRLLGPRIHFAQQILFIIIHQIFLLACDRSKRVTWLNIPGVSEWYAPIFKSTLFAKNYLKDTVNTIVSIWHKKYIGILVLGHYLFLKANSFPRATLSKHCLLPGTDYLHDQISEHIFLLNGGYCLFSSRIVQC